MEFGDDNLAGVVQLVDHIDVDLHLGDARVRLIDLHDVPAVVLDIDVELCALDPQCCVPCDEDGPLAVIPEVQAGRQDAVVRCGGIEDLGKSIGVHAVELDPDRSTSRKGAR